MKNSFMRRFLCLLLLVCSAILVLGASYALRIRCEAFGCPNAGILWSIWTLIYLAIGTMGLRLRTGLVPGTPTRTLASACLATLAAVGLALAGYWWFSDPA